MMTRQERAKQFMPFDAMKGLQAALHDREERHSRVPKHEVSEEIAEKISDILTILKPGMGVTVEYYKAFHDVTNRGVVAKVDTVYKYIIIGNEKILFNDIYDLEIIEM